MSIPKRSAQRARDALDSVEEREHALRVAEELAHRGSWMWEVGANEVTWSDQVHRIFGTDPAGPLMTYEMYLSMVHPDDLKPLLAEIQEKVSAGGAWEVDHRIIRRDGEIREVLSTGRAELDAAGRPIRLAGGVQDVTEARRTTRELNRTRDLFAGVLNAATEQSIIATDPQGLITVFNTGAERMLGYSAQEMIGTSPERLHDPDEIRARAEELGIEADFGVFLVRAAAGEPETRQWSYIARDGRRLLASITVSAMRGPEGELSGFIKVGTDITDLSRTQTALQESESRYRGLFEFAPNAVVLLAVNSGKLGRFLEVNPAMCQLTGYSEEQLLAMELSELATSVRSEHSRDPASALPPGPLSGTVEQRWTHADGSELRVQLSLNPRTATATATSVVGQVEDITARKRAEEALRHQALHDGLTGLPNRRLLMERIERALAASVSAGGRIGVLYIDLDGFKAVNDSAGHAAGDEALVHVADRLRTVVRPGDTLARVGGDEFVVVCQDLESDDAAARMAARVLTGLRTPFHVGATVVALSGSVGVSLSEPSSTAERLLHQADQAMYVAKGGGPGRIQVAHPDDAGYVARTTQAMRLMRLSAELGYALERNELLLYGQPILDVTSGRVVAVESLLRWAHPERGILAPGEFLDVAEETNLIVPIGRWVLQDACRIAATWVDRFGSAAPVVHVNVSGRQLEAGNLREDVVDALSASGLDPTKLVLELTETHKPLIDDSLRTDLQMLRDQGIKVAIDDVGTGYGGLARITELPVDILKIAHSFVAGVETDPVCAAVARGVLSIGNSLGLEVIAEGVEAPSQVDRLSEYGCTLAQGYLYSLPLPEQALMSQLTAPTPASGLVVSPTAAATGAGAIKSGAVRQEAEA